MLSIYSMSMVIKQNKKIYNAVPIVCHDLHFKHLPLTWSYTDNFLLGPVQASDLFTRRTYYSGRPFIRIDLFAITAAILNSLDLRSIMGCPGGTSTIRYTRSVFTRAFRANFSLRFPRKTL